MIFLIEEVLIFLNLAGLVLSVIFTCLNLLFPIIEIISIFFMELLILQIYFLKL